MKNKIHKTMAWITALILLFSAFFTQTGIVNADTPTTIDATVVVVCVSKVRSQGKKEEVPIQ